HRQAHQLLVRLRGGKWRGAGRQQARRSDAPLPRHGRRQVGRTRAHGPRELVEIADYSTKPLRRLEASFRWSVGKWGEDSAGSPRYWRLGRALRPMRSRRNGSWWTSRRRDWGGPWPSTRRAPWSGAAPSTEARASHSS